MGLHSILNQFWPPFLVTVLGGILLLLLEYRTGLFARWRSSRNHEQDELASKLTGEFVTPIAQLENSTGDWIQVAEGAKRLLEQVTKEERQSDWPVVLRSIRPKRNNTAELEFSFLAFEEGDPDSIVRYLSYVTVDAEGRITKFVREY